MKKKLLSSILFALGCVGLLAGITLATPVSEPVTMLCFGTGLVGFAGIMKKND